MRASPPVVKVVDGLKWKVKISQKKEVKLKSFIPQLLFFYKNINIVFFSTHSSITILIYSDLRLEVNRARTNIYNNVECICIKQDWQFFIIIDIYTDLHL